MKKRLLIISSFFFLFSFAKAQMLQWQWAIREGNTKGELFSGMTSDNSGNIISVGNFYNTSIILDGITLNNTGVGAAFIMKQNSSGNVLWAKAINSPGPTPPMYFGVCSDKNGFIYATGRFKGTVTFDTITINSLGEDVFLAKYDPTGNVIWVKKSATSSPQANGKAVCTDKIGNIYIAGCFNSTSLQFGNDTLVNSGIPGSSDNFIVKYNSNGNIKWAALIKGNYTEFINSISADSIGNLYILGDFLSDTLKLDNAILTNSVSDLSTCDVFVARYDTNGKVVWAKSASNIEGDQGACIHATPKGDIFAIGTFEGSDINFDTTNIHGNGVCSNTFCIRFNKNGNLLWGESFGDQNNNTGNAITADAEGNAYITGSFFSSINIGGDSLISLGWGDVYVAKMNGSGQVICALNAGGDFVEDPIAIVLDPFNNGYVAGVFKSSEMSFGSHTILNDSSNANDIFIAKFSFSNGVHEISQSLPTLTAYPNPATNALSVQVPPKTNIVIFNPEGQCILKTTSQDELTNLDISALAPGMYFIKAGAATGKFVKQ